MRGYQQGIYFAIITELVLFGPLPAQEREIKFKHLNINEGLAQSTVHAIAQDRLGFLWFGTADGLIKYDGYTFTRYNKNSADSNTISENEIFRLLVTRDGNLWIATVNNGLNCYDHERD